MAWVLRPTAVFKIGEIQIIAGTVVLGQETIRQKKAVKVYLANGTNTDITIIGTMTRGETELGIEGFRYEGPQIQSTEITEGSLVSDLPYDEAVRALK